MKYDWAVRHQTAKNNTSCKTDPPSCPHSVFTPSNKAEDITESKHRPCLDTKSTRHNWQGSNLWKEKLAKHLHLCVVLIRQQLKGIPRFSDIHASEPKCLRAQSLVQHASLLPMCTVDKACSHALTWACHHSHKNSEKIVWALYQIYYILLYHITKWGGPIF